LIIAYCLLIIDAMRRKSTTNDMLKTAII